MKKILMLSSILLLSAVCAMAQYGSQDNSNQSSANQNSSNNSMTVQGCLSGSDGNYTLTDKSGMAYQLSGDTSRLSAHVGHTISVTGTSSNSSAANQTGSMSSPSDSHSSLMVSSFRNVSATCSGASQ